MYKTRNRVTRTLYKKWHNNRKKSTRQQAAAVDSSNLIYRSGVVFPAGSYREVELCSLRAHKERRSCVPCRADDIVRGLVKVARLIAVGVSDDDLLYVENELPVDDRPTNRL